LARRIQAHYDGVKDFSADFEQLYTGGALRKQTVERGTVQVKKPGRMRWDYDKPTRKTIAVVGSRLVQYEPEVNQAFVDERFDATAMSAAVTFLLGQGSLEKEFEVASGEGGTLVLTPRKPDPRVDSVTLAVGPDGEVTASTVVDGSGNVNAIVFRDLKRNTGLKDSEFDLKLPGDVRRVEMPGAGR
jgi:outer membrane lipoprotein carrier protein